MENLNHAISKHGRNARVVINLLNSGKVLVIYKDLEFKRIAKICYVDSNRWGIGIYNKSGYMITAYIKNEPLENVREYFKNQGWVEG